MSETKVEANRYKVLVEHIFFAQAFGSYAPGKTELAFEREDLERAAEELGIKLPKNLGDVVYSIRYRVTMPDSILATQPDGMEWIIEGAGRARYRFCLVPINRVLPNRNLVTIKVPDATPEIIGSYALND